MKKTTTFYKSKYHSMLAVGTVTMAAEYLMLPCHLVVAGQLIGEEAVAAVNVIVPINCLISFLAAVIGEGVSILYTRAIGAMDRKRADQLFSLGLISACALAVLMCMALLTGREPYLSASGAGGMILTYAREYYRLLPLNAVLLILRGFLEQAVFSDGDEGLVMVSYLVQIPGNIILSVVLGMRMGMDGIMLGNVIGSLAVLGILMLHFLKRANTLRFTWYYSWKDLGQCIRYSLTDAMIYLMWSLMDFFLVLFISRRFGEAYLAILAIVLSLIELGLIFDGIGMAIQPFISVYFGERNQRMIRRLMKDATADAILEGILATVVVFAFAPQFAWLFGISNSAMTQPAVTAIRIVSLTLAASSVFALVTSYYLDIDRIGISIGLICLKDGLCSILLPLLCSLLWGLNGLWIGLAAAPMLGLALSVPCVYFISGRKGLSLLPDESGREIIIYDTELSEMSMVETSIAVRDQMRAHHYSENDVLKASLFVEEISATVREKNGNRKVLMEYTLLFEKDSVRLVTRDTGVIFDVTDPELPITGLSSFFVKSLFRVKKEKTYVPTTGYNRNMIRFDLNPLPETEDSSDV